MKIEIAGQNALIVYFAEQTSPEVAAQIQAAVASVQETMREILAEIQSGQFADEWVAESESGRENYHRMQDEGKAHPIETVGAQLRAMMPWISAGKQKVAEASGGDS